MSNRQVITTLLVIVALLIIGVVIFTYILGDFSRDRSAEETVGKVDLFPLGADRPTLPADFSTPSEQLDQPIADTLLVGTPGLKRLTPGPVSGATFFKNSAKLSVLFVERESGNIFRIEPDQDFPLRVTNNTLPRIQEVHWGIIGTSTALITRAHKAGVENMAHQLWLDKTATTTRDSGKLETALINPDINRLAISPNKKNVFFLESGAGGAVGSTANLSLQSPNKIFDHPLGQWEVAWPSQQLITLQLRPSAGLAGILLGLNPTNNAVSVLLNNIPGLTAKVSPDTKNIFYSRSDTSNTKAFLRVAGTDTDLEIATLADKCTWHNDNRGLICGVPTNMTFGNFPDLWYRGGISLRDNIWRVDIKNKKASLLLGLADNNPDYTFDIIDPTIDADNNYLLFINRFDGSLWILDLNSVR